MSKQLAALQDKGKRVIAEGFEPSIIVFTAPGVCNTMICLLS